MISVRVSGETKQTEILQSVKHVVGMTKLNCMECVKSNNSYCLVMHIMAISDSYI